MKRAMVALWLVIFFLIQTTSLAMEQAAPPTLRERFWQWWATVNLPDDEEADPEIDVFLLMFLGAIIAGGASSADRVHLDK